MSVNVAGSATESVLRIGVFGGTFNPPHRGHLRLAGIVREQFGLDRVLWIPNSRSPFKTGEELADAADRLAMVRAATAEERRFFSLGNRDTTGGRPRIRWKRCESYRKRIPARFFA